MNTTLHIILGLAAAIFCVAGIYCIARGIYLRARMERAPRVPKCAVLTVNAELAGDSLEYIINASADRVDSPSSCIGTIELEPGDPDSESAKLCGLLARKYPALKIVRKP
jgi:hypothetical protein